MSLCNKNWFFVTIYRCDGFTKEILDDLRPILASVCIDFESELIEFEGENDHVHLLVNYPPKVAVSTLVNSLKGIASLMIHKKNDSIIQKNFRETLCGHQATLQNAAAAARQFPLFTSMLSNGRRYAKLKAKERKAALSTLTSLP